MIPRIRHVHIRNYKSIGQAVVDLEPLTAFVGPSGAGKSNFIDALAFVQECLSESIELAFKNRGGISAVRRRSGGHPTHIAIRLTIDLGNDTFFFGQRKARMFRQSVFLECGGTTRLD